MLFLYGTRESFLSDEIDRENACLKCKSIGIHVAHYQRYFHVFFLPTFPIGKSLKVKCLSCAAEQQQCATTALLARHNVAPKTPVRFWAGTFLAVIAITAFASLIFSIKQENQEYIQNPRIGDIYTYYDSVTFESGETQKANQYFKVYNVKGDSVYLIQGNYAFKGYVRLSELLKKDDLFTDWYVSFHKTQIKDLYDKDKITSIYRSDKAPYEAGESSE